jgi:uncharacterized hydrophobic protein (TIGR00271 family)
MQVFPHDADRVVDAVRRNDGLNCATSEALMDGRRMTRVTADVPNRELGALLAELEGEVELWLSFAPSGVLALRPPPGRAPDEVTDPSWRSPVEIYLSGLQSIGSWRGFLGYAVASGAVVWFGLLTGTVYLLTAAMLIAPFAGPAMNAALGAASGDGRLLGRSLVRYVTSLGVTIATCGLLSLIFGHRSATEQMLANSSISALAVILPLSAGVAGALHLVQSDRASLVSGAGVGILVAASLAPPAGVVGMSLAIGRWELALDSGYLLALQLVGIHLSAGLVFRLAGLAGGGARQHTSRFPLFAVSLAAAVVGVGALLGLQLAGPVDLERTTVARDATAEVEELLARETDLVPLGVDAEVVRAKGEAPVLHVQARAAGGRTARPDALEGRLGARIGERLRERWPEPVPVVEVTVVPLPEAGGEAGGGERVTALDDH